MKITEIQGINIRKKEIPNKEIRYDPELDWEKGFNGCFYELSTYEIGLNVEETAKTLYEIVALNTDQKWDDFDVDKKEFFINEIRQLNANLPKLLEARKSEEK